MKITLLVSDNCPACERALSVLSNFRLNNRKLTYAIINIADPSVKAVPIVPALFVNEKLFSYGDVDTNKLTEYISNL